MKKARLVLAGCLALGTAAVLSPWFRPSGGWPDARPEGTTPSPSAAAEPPPPLPEWEGVGGPDRPVTVGGAGDAGQPVRVRLKDMGYKDVVRVHWRLLNPGAADLPLRRVVTDCSCVHVRPESGVVPAGGALDGSLDYTQGTLGYTRRVIVFETAAGERPVELYSLKLRDQHVTPEAIRVRDENASVVWDAAYVRGRPAARYRLAKVEADENVLELVGRVGETDGRSVEGVGRRVDYEIDRARLTFRINPSCPVGRYETAVRLTVADSAGGPDTTHRVPAFVTVHRGIEVRPSAVALGYNVRSKTSFPLRRTVRVAGVSPGQTVEFTVEPPGGPVEVRVAERGDAAVSLAVSVRDSGTGSGPLKATIVGVIATPGASAPTKVRIPVSGIFANAPSDGPE